MSFLIFPEGSERTLNKTVHISTTLTPVLSDIGRPRGSSQHLLSLLLHPYFKLKNIFVQVFQHFISRVRQKLHIVLCMSPVGEAFRSRCRMFPSLVNCCTIDWFVQVGDIPGYLFGKMDSLGFKGVTHCPRITQAYLHWL